MLYQKLLRCTIFITAIAACSDETVEEPLILKGQIKGKVNLLTEFGLLETTQSGADLRLEGSEGPLHASTDSEGRFTLDDVPTGTYNIVVEKNGFTTARRNGFSVMGGEAPLYSFHTLVRPSTSIFQNLSMVITAQGISFNGNLVHNNPSQFPYIKLVAYYGNTSDISPEKHLNFTSLTSGNVSGSELTWNVYLDPALFPSGSTVYGVVYAYSGFATLNLETYKYEFPGLGKPSNIASVEVP